MTASLAVAFGSRLAGSQFATWNPGITLRPEMVETALGIFVLDAIIQNDDRREGSANCLVLGQHLRIIDHEPAFAHRLIIGWQPPWQLGGLQRLVNPGAHIFRDKLRRAALNFDQIRAAWADLSDGRIDEYASGLPAEWASAAADAAAAIRLIKDARDHTDGCLNEKRNVQVPFEQKVVAGALDSITFEHAWKNGSWHVYEPVSLDLADRDGIMAKTHRWLGHLAAVQDGAWDPMKLHFLLGAPQDPELEPAYRKAVALFRQAARPGGVGRG